MTDLRHLVATLSLDQKISLLSGQDLWTLPAIPDIGLESLVMSDGPVGVRGTDWLSGDPATLFPSPSALAATWDPELVRRVGRALGAEAVRKKVHMLLAPNVNLQRSPYGGRHFEQFSEDAVLTAEISLAYVDGVQSTGVGACVKHLVCNDFETDRMTVDVVVDEATLRELYLYPFERMAEAGVWSMMSAYNSVNGHSMAENERLLTDVLKTEWGYDGPVVSDWYGARSTTGTAVAGLDVVMPGQRSPWGEQLRAAVDAGEVSEALIDDKVLRILELARRTGALAGSAPRRASITLDTAEVAREAATRSLVLVKNAGGALPLEPGLAIVLVGEAARNPRTNGGGSAHVSPMRIQTPLDSITDRGLLEAYHVGPPIDLRPKPAAPGEWTELTVTFLDSDGEAIYSAPLADGSGRWWGEIPGHGPTSEVATIVVDGTLRVQTSGMHVLELGSVGVVTATLDGAELLAATFPGTEDPADSFLNPPTALVEKHLSAGDTPRIAVRIARGAFAAASDFLSFDLRYAAPQPPPESLIDQAIASARDAAAVVVVVANDQSAESEGFDRTSLALPGSQNEMVSRIAAVNPRTIVVVNSGAPVEMPWFDEVGAVLISWFPGQEGGDALADVLWGRAEPTGRLPTTWLTGADSGRATPVIEPRDGRVVYAEREGFGYRDPARRMSPDALAFGHGLGYSRWSYVAAERSGDEIVVNVRNAGERPSREVVQLYAVTAGEPRLAGFASVSAGPGETAVARIPIDRSVVRRWGRDGWVATQPDSFAVGASAVDLRLTLLP